MISHIKIAIAGTISAKFVVIKKRLIPGRLGLGSSQLIVKLFGVFRGILARCLPGMYLVYSSLVCLVCLACEKVDAEARN